VGILVGNDFNGDGLMDLLVGGPEFTSGEGKITVFDGSSPYTGTAVYTVSGKADPVLSMSIGRHADTGEADCG
jgi:hypothetical protein